MTVFHFVLAILLLAFAWALSVAWRRGRDGRIFFVERDVSYGQFANCLVVLHVGYTAYGINTPCWLQRRHYGARLEIMTDGHRFRFRGFSFERRRRAS